MPLLKTLTSLAAGLLAMASAAAAQTSTLETVRARGAMRCGVTELGQLLSTINVEGRWIGFYSEFCRAIAAATTGSADNVDFVLVAIQDRFKVVRDGDVDVLAEASTWTLARDDEGLTFAGNYFMDSQGFLVRRAAGLKGLADMKGRKICVQDNTTSIDNVREVNAVRGLGMDVKAFGTIEGAYAAFFGHQCESLSTDSMILTSMRQLLAPNPDDYLLLPDRISKEPIGPVVRENDSRWEDAVRWTLFAMIAAEELGITQANAAEQRRTGTGEARRLLGGEPGFGAKLGLSEDWAFNVITQVGNYGEVFERSLGGQSLLKMERGLNDLWSRGGLLWAPPIR